MSIQILEAHIAITNLIYSYAKTVREGRGGACGQYFTEDAVFTVRQAACFGSLTYSTLSTTEGREEIAARIVRSASPEARICPSISNLLIEVSGIEASSSCVMTTLGVLGGFQTLGEYADTFRNEDGWRFASRTFTMVVAG